MKTLVITGGTDGIGRGLALAHLERGDEVVVVGRDAVKGEAWLDTARRRGAAGRARFVRADLSLIAENRSLIDLLRSSCAGLDALVLCARHFRSTRLVTADGFESTFAHFYLSRYLLSHGLADLLDRADAPVVLNVAGPGSSTEIDWDDLQCAEAYDGRRALAQSGRLNDLLGVGFAARRPAARARYVLYNPGTVSTGFSGEYDAGTLAQVEAMRRSAPSVEAVLAPILRVLDDPPGAALSAFVRGAPLDVDGSAFAVEDARRLERRTAGLLRGLTP